MIKFCLLLIILISPVVFADDYIEISVKSKSYSGQYSPKNCGAIWVCDEEDNFVKTLKIWSIKRRRDIMKWIDMTGENTVDAITSATMKKHMLHTVQWDFSDYTGKIVDDSKYRIYIEFTEDDSHKSYIDNGPWRVFEFVKNGQPGMLNFEDTEYFSDIKIDYFVPSGIEDNITTNISAYPNPFDGQTTISFGTLTPYNIRIFNVFGKECYTLENVNSSFVRIDLTDFPSGVYYCNLIYIEKSYTIKLINLAE